MPDKKKADLRTVRTHALGTELYTTEQVAADLQLGMKMIRQAIKEGKLKARKAGRQYLMTREAVREYWESLPEAAEK